MSQAATTGTQTVALRLSQRGNRRLLEELLGNYEVVEVGDATVPDLCIVDEGGLAAEGEWLARWRAEQEPVFAPVLLVARADRGDPWSRYADTVGERIDAIQPVPASRAAIRAQIESLFERRRYAARLAEERQLTERIFETSPVALTLLDTEGRILRANGRAEEVLGLARSAMTDRTYDAPEWQSFDEAGAPLDSAELPFARVMATGESVYGDEHGIERADGERAWLSINMAPIRDKDGELEYLIAAMEDITEQKQLEQELRASEELHRATLANIRDTVFITDEAGRFTYVCPNTSHIFGYQAEEIEKMGHVEDLLDEDPLVEHPRAVAEGGVQNLERTVTDAGGAEHTVLISIDPVSIMDGSRLYTIRDITERKRQERRFQALIEHSSDIVTVLDDDGVIEYVSPSVERVLGHEPEAIVGQDGFTFIHEDDRERVFETFLRGLEDSGTELRETYRFEAADGEWRWLESVASTAALPEGNHVINSRDVTERVVAERERRIVEESRSLALEAANAGIWSRNLATDEVWWHESTERLFGLVPGSFEGTYEAFADRVHPDDIGSLEAALRRTTARRGDVQHTFRIRRTDGGERWVEMRGTVIEGSADEPNRLLGVIMDITEQHDRLQQLRVLSHVLRHTLRNEMNLVRGYAESLEETTPAQRSAYLAGIVRVSDGLLESAEKAHLISRVLTADPTVTELDVATLASRAVETIGEQYPAADLTLSAPEAASAIGIEAVAAAITELLENAVTHHDGTNPQIECRVQVDGETVAIEVEDDGPGIPEMERTVITGEAAMEPLHHGSGLGLWLVAWTVHQSGGRVEFETTDRGSLVRITLPSGDDSRS